MLHANYVSVSEHLQVWQRCETSRLSQTFNVNRLE